MNIHVKHTYSRGDYALLASSGKTSRMNIAPLRKQRGLTQEDLADLTKLTQPTISRAERGDDGATLATFKSIAAALQVPLEALFSAERSLIESELLAIFRTLPAERQKGWLDMARLASQGRQEPI